MLELQVTVELADFFTWRDEWLRCKLRMKRRMKRQRWTEIIVYRMQHFWLDAAHLEVANSNDRLDERISIWRQLLASVNYDSDKFTCRGRSPFPILHDQEAVKRNVARVSMEAVDQTLSSTDDASVCAGRCNVDRFYQSFVPVTDRVSDGAHCQNPVPTATAQVLRIVTYSHGPNQPRAETMPVPGANSSG